MATKHTDETCDNGNAILCPGCTCGDGPDVAVPCPVDECDGTLAIAETFDPFDRIACGLCPPGGPCDSCALTIHEMGCSRASAA